MCVIRLTITSDGKGFLQNSSWIEEKLRLTSEPLASISCHGN